jgi:hypothetical protein
MIYKQDLSLFSEEELLNLRTAITERLESYKGNALDRESFEAQLGALKVMVEASDPNELGGVNKAKLLDNQLATLESSIAYAEDYDQDIQSLYDQIQALLPRWKQVINQTLGGRKRFRFRFVMIFRRHTRTPFRMFGKQEKIF